MVLHALLFCFIGLGCQKVVLHFLIGKLHKAEPCFVPMSENKKI